MTKKDPVYLYGWAGASKTSRDLRPRFNGPGNISGIDKKAIGGYQIAHKLELLQGMSGGPLLHGNGCLVGINGSSDKDLNTGTIEYLAIPTSLYATWKNISIEPDCRTTPLANRETYKQLESFLDEKKWEEADIETKRLMLRQSDKPSLNNDDIEKLPCQDLKIINRLWYDYSHGRFGFSVQNEIWKAVNQNKDQFDATTGWRRGFKGPLEFPPKYSIEASKGHLPSYNVVSNFENFLKRIDKCGNSR